MVIAGKNDQIQKWIEAFIYPHSVTKIFGGSWEKLEAEVEEAREQEKCIAQLKQ